MESHFDELFASGIFFCVDEIERHGFDGGVYLASQIAFGLFAYFKTYDIAIVVYAEIKGASASLVEHGSHILHRFFFLSERFFEFYHFIL